MIRIMHREQRRLRSTLNIKFDFTYMFPVMLCYVMSYVNR